MAATPCEAFIHQVGFLHAFEAETAPTHRSLEKLDSPSPNVYDRFRARRVQRTGSRLLVHGSGDLRQRSLRCQSSGSPSRSGGEWVASG